MATPKRTPQKPKAPTRKPKAKRAKPDPRRNPKGGFIPSDNPRQSRTY